MDTNTTEEINLSEKCLEVIKIRIIEHVKHNVNTKFNSEKEMVDEIRKIIMEEANKNY